MPRKQKYSLLTSLQAEKTKEEKLIIQEGIAMHFAEILKLLGLNLKDPSLIDTPKRVAKMYVNELFSGLLDPLPVMTRFPSPEKASEMVLVRDINLVSCCEHHFLPIVGKAHVAYLPESKIIGLSKINRLVKHLASRPQVQERLTRELGYLLQEILQTENVAVVIDAIHYCTTIRGIRDQNSTTVTSFLGGCYREGEARAEFFNLIKL